MYEPSPDPDRLRQGDVIADFYFPRYSLPNLELLHKFSDDGALNYDGRSILKAEKGFAVIISQCCEFNPKKRKWFSVASLAPLRRQQHGPELKVWGLNIAALIPVEHSKYRGGEVVTQEQIDFLRDANEIDPAAEKNHAVNAFLYDPDGEVMDEPHLVNFSQVVSVRLRDRDKLLESKVLQLDRDHRHMLQNKIAYFYARRAEEVED